MRAEAATALTSSSRSCRPTVMAGSTRGSKAEIRSWERYREKTRQIMVSAYVYTICVGIRSQIMTFTVTSLHVQHKCLKTKRMSSSFHPHNLYSQTYGAQIKYIMESCCAHFRAHHIHTEQVVPVGLPGHIWSREGLHDGPPTGLLLAASAGHLLSWKHQFHSCGEGPHRVSGHTSPWQEPPPGRAKRCKNTGKTKWLTPWHQHKVNTRLVPPLWLNLIFKAVSCVFSYYTGWCLFCTHSMWQEVKQMFHKIDTNIWKRKNKGIPSFLT